MLPVFQAHRRAADFTPGSGRFLSLAEKRRAGNRRRDKMTLRTGNGGSLVKMALI